MMNKSSQKSDRRPDIVTIGDDIEEDDTMDNQTSRLTPLFQVLGTVAR